MTVARDIQLLKKSIRCERRRRERIFYMQIEEVRSANCEFQSNRHSRKRECRSKRHSRGRNDGRIRDRATAKVHP